MSDALEILFTDGDTGDSVCLYARWGIYSGEDALFLALTDHKDRWNEMDILAHSTMRHIYDLVNDGDNLNYGLSAHSGRCTEQLHVDVKSHVIRTVTVDYSKDISEQTTVHRLWTFQEFYENHLHVGREMASCHFGNFSL